MHQLGRHHVSTPARSPGATDHSRPRLEQLEDRLVPSTLVDLTTRGAAGTINQALFRQCDAQPTGTGVIRSFVRLQTPGAGATVEQGYNTEARPLQFDENRSPQFTRSLRLGDVPRVVVNGATYREFLLDINQRSSEALLSLDELRVYLGLSPNLTGYDPVTKRLAGQSAVYDLDGTGDSGVKLNYRLNSGSGAGDMFALVPEGLFAGGDAGSYVYLYSKFGGQHAANAGFEEWAVRAGGATSAPPVALSSLSGYVYVDRNDNGVRETGEAGLAGVTLQLSGTNDLGETVVLTAVTDANGFYSFTGLRPGTYTILESQPDDYLSGFNSVGSQGGLMDGDRFFDIALAAGVNGVENNFAELQSPS